MKAISVLLALSLSLFIINSLKAAPCDIDGDGKTGLEEAIYALQVAAGLDPNACMENSDCSLTGNYCRKPVGECAEVGSCLEMPVICPDVWDPVCGCDNNTFSNECEAAAAGVSVAYSSECVCTSNSDCEPGEFCTKEVGDCTGEGVCNPIPADCPDLWEPVCGCDGITYANLCFVSIAAENVAQTGECNNGN